jgi:hypothetical protein
MYAPFCIEPLYINLSWYIFVTMLFVMWLLEYFHINPLVLIMTSNFGIYRFWVNLMPCCTQYTHPLRMDYIYYKPNEQYFHMIGLTHFVAMLKHLNNTFIILTMKYSYNNLNEKCNLIFLYNTRLFSWKDPLVHKLVCICKYCKLLIFFCLWLGFPSSVSNCNTHILTNSCSCSITLSKLLPNICLIQINRADIGFREIKPNFLSLIILK